MPQMSIDRAYTPQELVLRVKHDPTQPELGFTVSAAIHSATGSVIGSGSCALIGVEVDHLGTIVERIAETFMWGNPTVLHHVIRQSRRTAKEHAARHAQA